MSSPLESLLWCSLSSNSCFLLWIFMTLSTRLSYMWFCQLFKCLSSFRLDTVEYHHYIPSSSSLPGMEEALGNVGRTYFSIELLCMIYNNLQEIVFIWRRIGTDLQVLRHIFVTYRKCSPVSSGKIYFKYPPRYQGSSHCAPSPIQYRI